MSKQDKRPPRLGIMIRWSANFHLSKWITS